MTLYIHMHKKGNSTVAQEELLQLTLALPKMAVCISQTLVIILLWEHVRNQKTSLFLPCGSEAYGKHNFYVCTQALTYRQMQELFSELASTSPTEKQLVRSRSLETAE